MKKILALLLLSALLACLVSCSGNPNTPGGTTAGGADALPTGVSAPIRVEEADLPALEDLTDWYSRATAREYVTNALIYSETDGTWHCWLYIGSYTEGDSVTLTEANGTLLINAALQNAEELGSEGLFYFTVERAAEPSFDLLLNNSFAGLILTLADTSLVK